MINILRTGQNPLPRLQLGWRLSRFYAWITPSGIRTHEFVCIDEMKIYFSKGWLMIGLDGSICLTQRGEIESRGGVYRVY